MHRNLDEMKPDYQSERKLPRAASTELAVVSRKLSFDTITSLVFTQRELFTYLRL